MSCETHALCCSLVRLAVSRAMLCKSAAVDEETGPLLDIPLLEEEDVVAWVTDNPASSSCTNPVMGLRGKLLFNLAAISSVWSVVYCWLMAAVDCERVLIHSLLHRKSIILESTDDWKVEVERL